MNELTEMCDLTADRSMSGLLIGELLEDSDQRANDIEKASQLFIETEMFREKREYSFELGFGVRMVTQGAISLL